MTALSNNSHIPKPSPAFIGASWLALVIGMVAFIVGLWNVGMELNEKGYYFAVLMYGLFSAVSLQKSVRDRLEKIPVTNLYLGLSWFSMVLSVTLLTVGLVNAASIDVGEKGFYAMAFVMAVFAAVAVQKNVRDVARFGAANNANAEEYPGPPARPPLPGTAPRVEQPQPRDAQHFQQPPA